jgi:hypothetical protein
MTTIPRPNPPPPVRVPAPSADDAHELERLALMEDPASEQPRHYRAFERSVRPEAETDDQEPREPEPNWVL